MDEGATQAFIIDTSFDDQKPVLDNDELNYQLDQNVVKNETSDNPVVHTDPSDTSTERERPPPKTEEEMRECRYCEFQAENWPMFAKHVFRPQHIKKVAEAYNIKMAKDSSLTCDVCSITCCGHLSFNAHILGAKHRKALDKKAAEKLNAAGGGPMKNSQFGNVQNKKPYDRVQKPAKASNVKAIGAHLFANHPQPLIGLEYVTEVQVAGQNPRYECSLCDAKFEQGLKFPHLVGQKHRMNVLKIKRADFIKELHPTSKKRSELTALLLRESLELELAEGRKEVKIRVEKPPPGTAFSTGQLGARGGSRGSQVGNRGRGGNRGQGGNQSREGSRGRGGNRGGASGPNKRGTWSKRGTPYSRGMGGGDLNLRGHQGPYDSYGTNEGDSWSTYDSYGNDGYGSFDDSDKFAYGIPYNSSLDKPNYGRSYQRSSNYGETYPESESTYYGSGQANENSGQSYSAPSSQIELPRNLDMPPKVKDISSGLASAIGDLTRLVKNEDEASVALQVSNALTKALLQYRMVRPAEFLEMVPNPFAALEHIIENLR